MAHGTRAPPGSSSASNLHRQAVTGTSTPAQAPTPPEQFFADALDNDKEEIDDAWGEMAEDCFFDASSEAKPPALLPVAAFDDGGEPDFEGWLQAQQKAKSKAPLPKGLTKLSASPNSRAAITRTTTTGSVGSGAGAQRLANAAVKPKPAPAKAINTKTKETDDDWGDAWD